MKLFVTQSFVISLLFRLRFYVRNTTERRLHDKELGN